MERKRRPNIHKKLLSALFALVMVAGVPAPAFAFDAAPVLPETAVTEPLGSETEIMEQIIADTIAAAAVAVILLRRSQRGR